MTTAWTDITESLPELNLIALLWLKEGQTNDGGYRIAFREKTASGRVQWQEVADFTFGLCDLNEDLYQITHWMPMPVPPMKEGKPL